MSKAHSGLRRFGYRGFGSGIAAIVLLVLTAPGLPAQVLDVVDISPDQSSLDPSAPTPPPRPDPDGASGGRVNGLATVAGDNGVFYAASEWGGVFESRDGGDTWSHLDGHVPVATWDVEVDPDDSDRIYATSFYDSRVDSWAGINVSTDGGATWNRAAATPPEGFCFNAVNRVEPFAFGIAIDPDEPANVFVGTNCGLAVSNDRGATWNFVDPTPANDARWIWDVVVHDDGIVDICGDDGHRRSPDRGATWGGATGLQQLPSGRCSLAVSPDESYVLIAVSGTAIHESDNGGTSWQVRYNNPRAQGRIPFLAINDRSGADYDLWFGDVQLHRRGCTTPAPAASGGNPRCGNNPAAGWIGPFTRFGPDGFRSADDGGHDDLGDIAFDSEAGGDACPTIFSSDGGIYVNSRTTSPDCHDPRWRQPTVTPHALWVWDFEGVAQAGEGTEDLYIGLQDNGSFGARDAGTGTATWNNRQCCDTHEIAADPSRVLWSVCCGASLLRSNPGLVGGNTINQAAGGLRLFERLDSIANFGPDDYVMASRNGVFASTNVTASPITWSAVGSGAPAGACAVDVATSGGTTTVFAKSGGCNGERGARLFRHTGTGSTGNWQQITRAGGGRFGVYAVDPGDPNRIFAADLAGATPTMVLTADGGATWTVLTGLDDLMDGGGVFRNPSQTGPSTQQGNAIKSFAGYPQPTLVAFDPEDEDILMAGGADSGLFLSVDGGTNWERLTDPPSTRTACTFQLPRPRFAHFDHDTAGRIRAYVGSQGRGIWRLEFTKDRGKLGANEAGDQMGSAVASGDFDGDGFVDVAVGAPGEAPGSSPRSGYVFVYKGSSTGLRPWQGLDQVGLGVNEADDRFGFSLAAGDFDGDGRDDLAVGAPGEAPGSFPKAGYVFAFQGSPTGLRPWRGLDQQGLGINEDGDGFGTVLAAGDFDGDGRDDLAVGAPAEGLGAVKSGYVFFFRGTPTGPAPWIGRSQAGMGANEADDRFGSALAAGDFDGDGRDDLAVGAPGESPGADPKSGYVFFFRGQAGGPVAWVGRSQAGLGANEAGDLMGSALAAGDFDGDGRDDLAVGAPGESPGNDPQSGYVFVFRGDPSAPVAWRGLSQRGLGVNEAGDLFGSALTAGDFTGDGVSDLTIGAPGEAPGSDPQSGFLFTFKGSAATLAVCRGVSQEI